MAKTLDFNRLKRPTLPLVMPDEARTKISVTLPTEGTVNAFINDAPAHMDALEAGADGAVQSVYEMTAELMSHNLEGIKVTALDLRDKFNLKLEDLVIFYGAYTDFINEVTNAKN